MRTVGSALIGLLLIASACTSATTSTSTLAPQPEPVAATTSTLTPTPPPEVDPQQPMLDMNGDIEGVLPDGSTYTAIANTGWGSERIEAITGTILIDLADGSSPSIGETRFHPSGVDQLAEVSHHRWPAGPWTVTIEVDESVRTAAGQDIDALLTGALSVQSTRGMPVVTLQSPLRWAGDADPNHPMEVAYTTFVVRRGCGELAAACSPTNGAQVIPAARLYPDAPAWDDPGVFLLAAAPRPKDDPTYLDPGPLSARGGHSVVWTGREMIVWGGADGDRPPHLLDGAAFDPATSTWRLLPTSPFTSPQVTHAVWADDRMIVVGNLATASYDPESNTWRLIADGVSLPRSGDSVIWTDSEVAVWSPNDVHLLDPATGDWRSIGHPGFGNPTGWEGTLRTHAGRLFAVGLVSNRCEGRSIAEWSGAEWELLPETSLATTEYADCSLANQTGFVEGKLVIWEERSRPTRAFDLETREWFPIDNIDLPGAEGPSGPVQLEDGVLVPQFGGATWLTSIDGEWHQFTDLPGDGYDRHMVWTGTELLMWGAECCYGSANPKFTVDAWRWTPPLDGS